MKRNKKRILAGIMILSLFLTVLSGCGSNPAPSSGSNSPATTEPSSAAETPAALPGRNVIKSSEAEYDGYVVKVVLGSGICGAPLHMAMEQGYFAEEGIEVEFVKVGDSTIHDLIATGKGDCGYAMLPDTILRIDQGFDCRIALGIHTGCLEILVKADSDITDITQLRGKKIGVPGLASSGRVFATRALQSKGVGVTADNMEVEFVAFSRGELSLMLENGTIDAVAINDPTAGTIVDSGVGRSILANATHPDYQDEICCVGLMGPKFVEEHPYAAAAFLRAIQKGGKFVTENPVETARIQIEKSYVGSGDPELFARLHQTYDYRTSVEGGYTGLLSNMQDLQEAGLISEDLDIEKVVARTYTVFDDVPESLLK
ncbi:MAG: ABC transporter substrate-binding protein [Clostridiales bacterium]